MFILNYLSQDIILKLLEYKQLKLDLNDLSNEPNELNRENKIIYNLHHQTELLEDIILLFDMEMERILKKDVDN